jgi:hypothetical protein
LILIIWSDVDHLIGVILVYLVVGGRVIKGRAKEEIYALFEATLYFE